MPRKSTSRKSSRKTTSRKSSGKTSSKKTSRKSTSRKSSRKTSSRKTSRKSTSRKSSRKTTSRKSSRKTTSRKSSRKTPSRKSSRKTTSSKRVYTTHFNGGRPFRVIVEKGTITIYKVSSSESGKDQYVDKVKTIKSFKELFIGKSPKNAMTTSSGGYGEKFDGNTLLIQVSESTFIHIGGNIIQFSIKDQPMKFVSPVGNNDVPYPYLIGSKNTYLLAENVFIPNDERTKQDPYDQYYGHSLSKTEQKKNEKRFQKNKIKFKKLD